MKSKILSIIILPLIAASCNRAMPDCTTVRQDATGDIVLNLDFPEGDATKAASAYTQSQTYESQVNSVQVLVFNSSGTLDKYVNAGTAVKDITVTTATGSKTVWAVVNGPSLTAVTTLTGLKATTLSLGGNNSVTASTGFVMAGSASCTVSSSSTTCSVSVSRFVSRVAVQSITNKLPAAYGSLTVDAVWLSNVVGNQTMDATASASTWYNKFGRADESPQVSSHIIDGTTYKASCPDLTFKAVGSTVTNGGTLTPSVPYLLYCMPNSSTVAPTSFSTTFSAQRTVLVVKATIAGSVYYYPVTLDQAAPARNTAYTVALTIESLGSDDPNEPVQKSSVKVSVSVSGWGTGTVYEQTI